MKWIFKFSLMMLIHISAFGQTPEKISYQAVIRDNNGVLIENSKVNLKIVLRQGSSNGATVYEELHNIMTNKNGLLSLEIGSGTISKGHFNEINWAKGPFFIETHVDPKGSFNYKLNGVSQLLSVPYALHAKSADSFKGIISPSQLPDFYTADEIDEIFLNVVTERTPLSSFSGNYNDLEHKPEIYNKREIDYLIQGIETTGVPRQNLTLEGDMLSISGGNSISFENWDTNVADDFSGLYDDLQNKPELYNKTEIDNLIQGIETTGGSPQNLNLEGGTLSISGGNSISFENWDTNAVDDFSGLYDDLQNKPELYNKTEIDNLLQGIETTGGSPQNLNLEGGTLSISGGNSISFENWDTNAADDFSGRYIDLQDKPELYSKTEIDNLIQGIETTGGSPQNLNLEGGTLSISGGNSISFENWDTNATDDFSGIYDDLQNKPELYSKSEIDNLIQSIETTGGSPQNLNLEGQTLTISGGNSISFENWDTNATDDFSGSYEDLQNKPILFSGQYTDLENKPELYSKTEIDNLIQGIETTGGSPQNLNLEGQTLSISGGNSISFENWDTNAIDDFSGSYEDLQNK
ncbi:hypothetical protein LZ575_03360 [Antarcticibacterium sp. 1MA-6-2]|uniref:hypothetical protein n=1 Tax=Antarcticibacterium sp. 1MA-6-2 TaxID=2908210 RepID=UPI001F1834F1|nr:hypothetical protein [Antarcticibacterium sp. 1MA-6-2]UJH91734.1 hypothetical protein LZ575_03360 [Antarcticibacterium sp. 1MA-6-2]